MDIEAAGIGRIEQRGMIAKPEAAALLATGMRAGEMAAGVPRDAVMNLGGVH